MGDQQITLVHWLGHAPRGQLQIECHSPHWKLYQEHLSAPQVFTSTARTSTTSSGLTRWWQDMGSKPPDAACLGYSLDVCVSLHTPSPLGHFFLCVTTLLTISSGHTGYQPLAFLQMCLDDHLEFRIPHARQVDYCFMATHTPSTLYWVTYFHSLSSRANIVATLFFLSCTVFPGPCCFFLDLYCPSWSSPCWCCTKHNMVVPLWAWKSRYLLHTNNINLSKSNQWIRMPQTQHLLLRVAAGAATAISTTAVTVANSVAGAAATFSTTAVTIANSIAGAHAFFFPFPFLAFAGCATSWMIGCEGPDNIVDWGWCGKPALLIVVLAWCSAWAPELLAWPGVLVLGVRASLVNASSRPLLSSSLFGATVLLSACALKMMSL